MSKYQISQEEFKENIEAFKDFISSGDNAVVESLSGVSKVAGVAKLVVDVRNWHMRRKIQKFVNTLKQQSRNKTEYELLTQRYGADTVNQSILISLDVMRSEKQAKAFAYLFTALLSGQLSWSRFSELQNILEKIDPSALDEDFNGNEPSYKLVVVGLAYIRTNYGNLTANPNGKLYNDFYTYIVKPYRNSMK